MEQARESAETTPPDLEEHVAELATNGLERESDDDVVAQAIESMVMHPDYPCLGAHSVFRRQNASVHVLDDLEDEDVTAELLVHLRVFASGVEPDAGFASFVAVFQQPVIRDERHFEVLLWQLLQRLHDADAQPWADGISPDPEDPHFAFSVGGTGFFVVGLHPQASRIARRAPLPTLVFNLHDQFEELRASGKYPRMRDTIRRRDTAVQGSVNPMVNDHGQGSEAAQYSGRAVSDQWQAPFTAHDADGDAAGTQAPEDQR
jgi:FPC/CPF motif-containing protein YcgG